MRSVGANKDLDTKMQIHTRARVCIYTRMHIMQYTHVYSAYKLMYIFARIIV